MMSAALLLIAKATFVIAFAMFAGWLARRRRAAVRHLIFAAAFAVLALLPAATAVMPAVPFGVRFSSTSAIEDTASATPLNRTVEALETLTFAAGGPSESHSTSRSWPVLSTSTLLTTVWLAGVICCLVPVALGLWQIRRVRRHGLPWRDAQAMTNDLARDAGIRRSIEVMVHEAIVGPMTCGVVRHAIVFPPDARTWCDADLRARTHARTRTRAPK